MDRQRLQLHVDTWRQELLVGGNIAVVDNRCRCHGTQPAAICVCLSSRHACQLFLRRGNSSGTHGLCGDSRCEGRLHIDCSARTFATSLGASCCRQRCSGRADLCHFARRCAHACRQPFLNGQHFRRHTPDASLCGGRCLDGLLKGGARQT